MVNMTEDVTVENEVKPEGADFGIPLPSGHKVWFRDLADGQRLMLMRAGQQARKRMEAIQESESGVNKIKAVDQILQEADRRMWDAIDSITIASHDVDLIMDAMISGEIDRKWAMLVLRRGTPEVTDDDAEEVKEVKPSRRANAKRTQVK